MIELTFVNNTAPAWFVQCWLGFTIYADYSPMKTKSISSLMNVPRYRFIIAAAWVTPVLYRREFRSRSHAILEQLK